MLDRVEGKKRFRIEKLEERIAPSACCCCCDQEPKVKGNNGTDRHDVRVAYDEDVPF